jgi:hypothetical protein
MRIIIFLKYSKYFYGVLYFLFLFPLFLDLSRTLSIFPILSFSFFFLFSSGSGSSPILMNWRGAGLWSGSLKRDPRPQISHVAKKKKKNPHAKKNTLRATTPSPVVSRPHDSHRVPPAELHPNEVQSQIVWRRSLLADEIFPRGASPRPKARSRINLL